MLNRGRSALVQIGTLALACFTACFAVLKNEPLGNLYKLQYVDEMVSSTTYAIERFRRVDGRLPRSLAEAKIGMGGIVLDPWGGPLEYRVAGDSFVVRSLAKEIAYREHRRKVVQSWGLFVVCFAAAMTYAVSYFSAEAVFSASLVLASMLAQSMSSDLRTINIAGGEVLLRLFQGCVAVLGFGGTVLFLLKRDVIHSIWSCIAVFLSASGFVLLFS